MALISEKGFSLTCFFKSDDETHVTGHNSHGTPATMASSESLGNGDTSDPDNNGFQVLPVSNHSLPFSPRAVNTRMILRPNALTSPGGQSQRSVFSPRSPQNLIASMRSRGSRSLHSSSHSQSRIFPPAPLSVDSNNCEASASPKEDLRRNRKPTATLDDKFESASHDTSVTEAFGTFESASVSNEEKSLELDDVFPNAFEQTNPTNHLSGIVEDNPFQSSTTSLRSNSQQQDDTEKLSASFRTAMTLDPFADNHDPFLSHSENDGTDHDLEELAAPVAVEPRILKLNDDSSPPSHVALAKQIQALQERQKESEEALKRELGEKDMMIATLAKQVEELSTQQGSIDIGSTKKKEKSKKKRSPTRFQGQTAARVGMLGEVCDISPKASPSIRRRTLMAENLKTETWLADLSADSNVEAPQRRRRESRANAKTAIPRRHGSTGAINMRSRQSSKIEANNGTFASDTAVPDLSADSDDQAARRREARAKAKKANPRRHGSTGAIDSRNSRPSKREGSRRFSKIEANNGAFASDTVVPDLSADSDDQAARRREARAKAKKANPRRHGSTGAIDSRNSRPSKREASPGRIASMFSHLVPPKLKRQGSDSEVRREARAKAKKGNPKRHGTTGAINKRTSRKSKTSTVDASMLGNPHADFGDLNLDDLPTPSERKISKNRRSSEEAKSKKPQLEANNGAFASDTAVLDLSADSDDEAARRHEARAKAKKANPKRRASTGAIDSRNSRPSKREVRPGRIASMFSHLVPPKLKRQGSDSEVRREARAKAKKGNPKRHGTTGAINKRTSRKSKTSTVDASMLGNPHTDFGDLNLDDLPTPSERKISKNRRSSEEAKSKKPQLEANNGALSIDDLEKAVTKGRKKSRRSLDVKDNRSSPSTPSTRTKAVTKCRRKSRRSLDVKDIGSSPSTPTKPDSKQMRRGSKKKNLVSKLKNSLSAKKDKRKLFVPPTAI